MRKLGKVLLALVALLLVQAAPTTILVTEHHGRIDPVCEGWLAMPVRNLMETLPANILGALPPMAANDADFPYASTSAGPVLDSDGRTAWFVDNPGAKGGGYFYLVTPNQHKQAKDKGWTLTCTLRVDTAITNMGFNQRATTVFYTNDVDKKRYGLWFGYDGSDTLAWIDSNGQQITAPTLKGNHDYHTYVITYDATSGKASVTVDGGAVTNLPGTDCTATPCIMPTSVVWGSATNVNKGRASFRQVEFEIGK